MTVDPRRDELESWIARTRANQRKLAVALGCAVVVAIALLVWRRPVGGVALAITVIVGLCGFWITSSHILDWKQRIADLSKPKNQRISGGGRRF